jgi:hypothetical protein
VTYTVTRLQMYLSPNNPIVNKIVTDPDITVEQIRQLLIVCGVSLRELFYYSDQQGRWCVLNTKYALLTGDTAATTGVSGTRRTNTKKAPVSALAVSKRGKHVSVKSKKRGGMRPALPRTLVPECRLQQDLSESDSELRMSWGETGYTRSSRVVDGTSPSNPSKIRRTIPAVTAVTVALMAGAYLLHESFGIPNTLPDNFYVQLLHTKNPTATHTFSGVYANNNRPYYYENLRAQTQATVVKRNALGGFFGMKYKCPTATIPKSAAAGDILEWHTDARGTYCVIGVIHLKSKSETQSEYRSDGWTWSSSTPVEYLDRYERIAELVPLLAGNASEPSKPKQTTSKQARALRTNVAPPRTSSPGTQLKHSGGLNIRDDLSGLIQMSYRGFLSATAYMSSVLPASVYTRIAKNKKYIFQQYKNPFFILAASLLLTQYLNTTSFPSEVVKWFKARLKGNAFLRQVEQLLKHKTGPRGKTAEDPVVHYCTTHSRKTAHLTASHGFETCHSILHAEYTNGALRRPSDVYDILFHVSTSNRIAHTKPASTSTTIKRTPHHQNTTATHALPFRFVPQFLFRADGFPRQSVSEIGCACALLLQPA